MVSAGYDENVKEKSMNVIDTFKKFIEDNKDELTALQIIYSKPYVNRLLTYEEIVQLANAVTKPPYLLTPESVWKAYEQLEKSKVRGVGPQRLLTNIISLVRFALGKSEALEPFPETVNRKFEEWILAQEKLGRKFTPLQKEWLVMIRNHIATSLSIDRDDFEFSPFYEKGGQ